MAKPSRILSRCIDRDLAALAWRVWPRSSSRGLRMRARFLAPTKWERPGIALRRVIPAMGRFPGGNDRCGCPARRHGQLSVEIVLALRSLPACYCISGPRFTLASLEHPASVARFAPMLDRE